MEILVSLTVFSAVIVGLYMATEGTRVTLKAGVSRSIESGFSQIQLAEIDAQNPSVETAYDVTTKTAFSLPQGEQFFYTRIVDSATTSPDVKQVNLYIFRNSTDSTPYRQFRRELAPAFVGFNLGQASTYYRDVIGRVWAPMATNFSTTAGSRVNGANATHTNVDGSALCPSVTNTSDGTLFQRAQESNNVSNELEYKFLATLGRSYTLHLAAAEMVGGTTTGQRSMRVLINGTQADTLDAVGETGSTCSALFKSYTVTPVDAGSGLGVVTVELTQNTGATLLPRLAAIGLERREQ